MNYRSMLKQKQISLLLIALAFPVSVTTSSLYAATTDVSITQQKKAISGVIFDGTMNEPLIGANVIVKGTTNGTVTDLDGKFTLEANPNDILVISSIGFKTIEVKASETTKGKILLSEDSQALDEVVIVGYGTQKKVNLTGAVASVSSEELKERVNTNVLASVQGQVPGVTIISRPGAAPSINFRGRGNLGTSSPLFVIDGAIADATVFSALDPNTIESVSFLKDAASSAIYGSRAAYGVVMVKTKGGKEGDLKINYNGYFGVKMATYTPKVLSSEWYARLANEAALNDNPNAQVPYTDEMIQKFRDGSDPDMYPNTNWYDLVLDDVSTITKHSLSFSGGNKVKYYTGLGYTFDDKFTPGANSNRYNLTTNISSDIKSWVSMRANINYIQDDNKSDKGGISYVELLTVPSTYVAKQSNGEWGSYEGGKPASTVNMLRNPLRKQNQGNWSKNKTTNTLLNLALDFKPVKGLVLTGEMIYKVYDYKGTTYDASTSKIKDFKTGLELNGSQTDESKMTYEWIEHRRFCRPPADWRC